MDAPQVAEVADHAAGNPGAAHLRTNKLGQYPNLSLTRQLLMSDHLAGLGSDVRGSICTEGWSESSSHLYRHTQLIQYVLNYEYWC